MSKPASGIHISLRFHRCAGPVTLHEGLRAAMNRACKRAGVHLVGKVKLRRFPDDTANIHGDLTESHFSGGTYRKQRFVQLDVVMCNESTDNTHLARALAREIRSELKPTNFVKRRDWTEKKWSSL